MQGELMCDHVENGVCRKAPGQGGNFVS